MKNRRVIRGRWLCMALILIAVTACGGPKTYPARGKLVFDKGDVKLLAGSTLYCQHENDSFQAFGEINADGTFALQMRTKEGRMLRGAPEGAYRAWIVLKSQYRKLRIDPQHLRGNKAASLAFKVPADGDVVLPIAPAKPGTRLANAEPVSRRGAPSCGGTEDDDGDPPQQLDP